jgi:hypothetical protein
MPPTTIDNQGLGGLLRQVADDGAHLARQEVALARMEFAEIARNIGTGTGFAVGAAMVGLLTVQMLFVGIVLVMGDALFRGRYWIAAFVLTVILAVVAFAMLSRARALLAPRNMIPDQTLSTLRRNGHG